MDKRKVRRVRDELQELLNQYARDTGMSVRVGNGRYCDKNVTFRLEVAETAEDGTVLDKEARDFQRLAHQYGFKAEDLGRQFTSRGDCFEITGLRIRAPKLPISVTRVTDGKQFVMPPEIVRHGLERKGVRDMNKAIGDGLLGGGE